MMDLTRCWLLSALLLLLSASFLSARDRYSRSIEWMPARAVTDAAGQTNTFLVFKGAQYDPALNGLPVYFERVKLPAGTNAANISVADAVYQPVPEPEAALLPADMATDIALEVKTGYEQRQPYSLISFVPLRRNTQTGKPERLISFRLVVEPVMSAQKTASANKAYAATSVLASGTWYRIGVTSDGIHKISYSFLRDLGIDVDNINPRNIRVYGNGGGMLPFANSAPRKDDLVENAIHVQGESDNSFDQEDYVLFYGQGPNRWQFTASDQRFHHRTHLYSDTTYYFITADGGLGKRLSTQASLSGGITVSTFDDYAYHESDLRNLVRSGREWYGESFEASNSYEFEFSFPNIDVTVPGYIKAEVGNRSSVAATYNISAGTGSGAIVANGFTLCPTCDYMQPASTNFAFIAAGPSVPVTITKNTASAAGWLNYIELNVRRNLIMTGDQLQFRDKLSVYAGSVAAFRLSGASALISVWEITDPAAVKAQSAALNGTVLEFSVAMDSLREFIAFNNTAAFPAPVSFGKVDNQDLHAVGPVDMVIVSHPLFLQQAARIAELHRDKDTLSVVIVTPQQVYNEFSSGAQDVSAIRDFMKMLYDRGANDPSLMPQYLLLFGDGSYDNKRRFTPNSNFIPTYQSANSHSPTGSYVSDDFFGLLDDGEGQWNPSDGDLVDVGIGRFPVRSVAEAEAVVNKVMRYTNSDGIAVESSCDPEAGKSSFGSWRNTVCFIADDQDGNLHLGDAEDMAIKMDTAHPVLNVDKIYLDAYLQIMTNGGPRIPDAKAALEARIDKGALIINYTGHGGEAGLTAEGLVDVSSVNQWKNINNLPLFVTATCEFSRFDDPERTTAGEYVLLNHEGGGIALLTTVRLVYAAPNAFLNSNFYDVAYTPMSNGQMPRIGDLIRLTKNASGSSVNNRNFILLGDPALRLAYPRYKAVTTAVNSQQTNFSQPDTIHALSTVTVSGYVAGDNGLKLTNYNGTLYPTVYDKANKITTLSNDGNQSPAYTFTLQKNILFKGRASVTNGEFTFSFIVPKDILYQYGVGKISYYFHDNAVDGNGYYENLVIGGLDSNAANDITGPAVDVYMNDSTFTFGGTTHTDPRLFAVIADSNGVNTASAGLGHDMIAILDEQQSKPILLNDYFETDLNTHKRGSIRYPFYDLPEGKHTLSVKVWDVHNNSSQSYTEFIVATSAKLALKHVLNYPNPFTTKTKFMFEYNQACDMLEVQVQVFSVSGRVVKTINAFLHADGGNVEPVEWDGTDDFGDKIGKGVYIYRLSVRNSLGEKAERYERLVILR